MSKSFYSDLYASEFPTDTTNVREFLQNLNNSWVVLSWSSFPWTAKLHLYYVVQQGPCPDWFPIEFCGKFIR